MQVSLEVDMIIKVNIWCRKLYANISTGKKHLQIVSIKSYVYNGLGIMEFDIHKNSLTVYQTNCNIKLTLKSILFNRKVISEMVAKCFRLIFLL